MIESIFIYFLNIFAIYFS